MYNFQNEKFKNSTFLITGASGMIGQNMVELLFDLNKKQDLNIKIIATDKNEEKSLSVFKKYLNSSNFKIKIADITELQIDENVDYIIHTAGITGGSKQHIDYPMRTINVAIEGTKRALDIAVEKKCKGFVYLSTLEVYGNNGPNVDNIYENSFGYLDPVLVRSSYSESKRMCECICASYTKQYGIPTYIARLTASFGKYVSYSDNRVFAQFAKSIINKQDIVLKSSGGTVRNYCDAADVALAFLIMIDKGEAGTAYNVANMDTVISIKDLALKFIQLYPEAGVELKFDLSVDPTLLGYNKEMKNVLNSERLLSLGWKPSYCLDDMIKKLVISMKENKKEMEDIGNATKI